jgi:hypothetical protein
LVLVASQESVRERSAVLAESLWADSYPLALVLTPDCARKSWASVRHLLGSFFARMKTESLTTVSGVDSRRSRSHRSALSLPQTCCSSNSEKSARSFRFPIEKKSKEMAFDLCCCKVRARQAGSPKLGYRYLGFHAPRALAKPPMSLAKSSRRQREVHNTSCRSHCTLLEKV